MLLQEATGAAHPLTGSLAEWVWLIPMLPFLGFVINGWLSLASAGHRGPADPSAAGHGNAGHGHGHSDHGGGAHGDDHHVARHNYAPIVSIVVMGRSRSLSCGAG